MAITRLADIIEPAVFAAYMREVIQEKSALIQSGIVIQSQLLNELVNGGGRTINMPFWNDLSGEDEVMESGAFLDPEGIGTAEDIAVLQKREKAWAAESLASMVAGDSALDAIEARVSDWWVRREQRLLLYSLQGVFASPTMIDHVENAIGEQIGASLILRAKQRLGDAADILAALFMNSLTFTRMQNLNLIDVIPDSRGEIQFPTYLGYRVIVDDTVPVTSTYLMANGVIARGDGQPVDLVPVETSRDVLASGGVDYLVHRRAFVLHPIGVAYTGAFTRAAPTNAELANGASWTKVYDTKNIGMVEIRHDESVID